MKVSLIFTVLNEATTVRLLWDSILAQTRLPDEVVVVDGGSVDDTFTILQNLASTTTAFTTKILQQPGNRSSGRNTAITHATHSLIACTDAGCVLDSRWLAELITKHDAAAAAVTAGYYRGLTTTSWQAAVVPYVLVMPDQIPQPPQVFLPATRSVLFTKNAWEQAGKFDESLSDNEDYAFAQKLLSAAVPMAFAPTAIAAWIPPTDWWATAKMFFRFARGDSAAQLWRPKVGLLFARYGIGLIALGTAITTGNQLLGLALMSLLCGYLLWSIAKNYRFVRQGWWWLPLLQLTADMSVLLGSLAGLRQRLLKQ